jgi:hypothetical protein
MRQLFDPVLLGELLVSFLSLVDLYANHLRILPFLFELLNLQFAHLFSLLLALLVLAVVNTLASPFTPALPDVGLLHLLAKILFNLFIFLTLEFLKRVFFLSNK